MIAPPHFFCFVFHVSRQALLLLLLLIGWGRWHAELLSAAAHGTNTVCYPCLCQA
jgi:hypothetical protein